MMIPPIARYAATRCCTLNTKTRSFPSKFKLLTPLLRSRGYAETREHPDENHGQKYLISLQRRVKMYPFPEFRKHSEHDRKLRTDGKVLELYIPRQKGASGYTAISAIWLRDNCSCKQCRNQDTGQRQINVLKGKIDCSIQNVQVNEGGGEVVITFGDGHRTTYTKQQLLGRRVGTTTYNRGGVIPITTWDAAIASRPPSVEFATLESEGLGPLLRNIREFGFCFVNGTPPTPEATESLLTAIGPIRNTHYGGFYDFTADLSSKDTAYTSESLEPHTDNTYFTEPTGLQALHLLSHTEGSGGESSLVDGFGAAERLFNLDKQAYMRLALTPVHAHASGNEGISIQPSYAVPVLSHDPTRNHLTQVRWNNADRAGVDCSIGELDNWYDAATKFDALLSDPKNQYWFQLKPGKMLIFDNWRVLHGRAAFTGKRRMCGGYINRDDFISKYRMTNMSDEDVRASTVTG